MTDLPKLHLVLWDWHRNGLKVRTSRLRGAAESQTGRRVVSENGELVDQARGSSLAGAARVRKLEATSDKKATKSELIVVATGSHECSEPLHFQLAWSFR